jgi:hypothetical protein
VHDHPGWLVDHQQVLILINDVERNGLRDKMGRFRRWDAGHHLLATSQTGGCFVDNQPIDAHLALPNQSLPA